MEWNDRADLLTGQMSDELAVGGVFIVLFAGHLDHLAALRLPNRQETIAPYHPFRMYGRRGTG